MVAYCGGCDEDVLPVDPDDSGREHCPLCQQPLADKGIER